ncbi:YrhK family protein [Gracilibacillus sp. JCM 18860]|uniref:YrhK family protein n=1 Tax=Gracilibacillus sp. JCM 18860 TaxID=1306159 RepID=UPI0006D04887
MRIPKIKNYTNGGDTKDISIAGQSLEIYFKEKYASLQLLGGDILVGIFFVSGSILNFFQSVSLYGNILYLLGSISLTIRPLLKITKRIWIYKQNPN